MAFPVVDREAPTMSFDTLKLERTDAAALLTINRPDKLNALNLQVLRELDLAITQLSGDPSLRCLIITGAGEKAFVAGADISELAALGPTSAATHARRGQLLLDRLATFERPVIAAINGFCLGGGLELALACDIRIASEKAVLGLPEVSLGLLPGFGGTQRLPRVVGRGKAMELILSGERIDAAEAHRIGLVERVVPAADLMATVTKLAATIASRGPTAVALAKRAVHTGVEVSLDAGLHYEAAQFGVVFSTRDAQEGTRAFLEKRPAKFEGC